MVQLKDVIWNTTGFEDLKKYAQKNNEFLREVATLLFERAKLEQLYADGLSKITFKARKICGESIGTLCQSWEEFASQTEAEATIHRTLSNDIIEEVTKPLKTFAETQKETRKSAVQLVESSAKQLTDKRNKELQAKKTAFNKAKECEHSVVQLENSRGKTVSDKELSKLDAKCRKAEESVEKSDKDYINKLVEAERARLGLNSSIESAANTLQRLEEERIKYFKQTLSSFVKYLSDSTPRYDECYRTVESITNCIDVNSDVQTLIEQRGSPRQPAEQIVFSCYEEDHGNAMETVRRKLALEQKRDKLSRMLIGEKKAKKGLTRLNSVYQDTPSFSTKESKKDVGFQLGHTKSVMNLLDASVFRINTSLALLASQEAPNHHLSAYINAKKDKQGMILCTLKLPLSVYDTNNDYDDDDDADDIYTPPNDYSASTYGTLSYPGNNEYEIELVDDEFDDVDPEFEDVDASSPPEGTFEEINGEHHYSSIDQCQADYEYVATENDELTIKPGDVITIIVRHDDGWWKGELNAKIGLFPASYVHEI